jgi:hypothetical protein
MTIDTLGIDIAKNTFSFMVQTILEVVSECIHRMILVLNPS